jgi:hypothetical protein
MTTITCRGAPSKLSLARGTHVCQKVARSLRVRKPLWRFTTAGHSLR